MRLGGEFGRDIGAGTAHAIAVRATALGNETVDDTVEGQPVIKAVPGQLGDLFDVFGRQVRTQLDDDIATFEREYELFFSHVSFYSAIRDGTVISQMSGRLPWALRSVSR